MALLLEDGDRYTALSSSGVQSALPSASLFRRSLGGTINFQGRALSFPLIAKSSHNAILSFPKKKKFLLLGNIEFSYILYNLFLI